MMERNGNLVMGWSGGWFGIVYYMEGSWFMPIWLVLEVGGSEGTVLGGI